MTLADQILALCVLFEFGEGECLEACVSEVAVSVLEHKLHAGGLTARYARHLRDATGSSLDPLNPSDLDVYLKATKAQRIQAILKTYGLWEET